MKENAINTVLANELCVGCGMCTYMHEDVIEMKWNENGFLVPHLKENASLSKYDLALCPFNPKPVSEVRTEDEIASLFLQDAPNYHRNIGRYNKIYAGYSADFRSRSSSGGIATLVFASLLESGEINHIISVRESSTNFYEYAISSTKEELLQASKTKYYPVTLATVLPKIIDLPGVVAISGVACFIKAIRLAQYHHPELRQKIKFLVGIICGGLKSSFFTDYLASKSGIEDGNFKSPAYRIKDLSSTAYDYSFGCIEAHTCIEKQIKMKNVGDMWGTGLFKAKACDFCDDVTTELADISLGDAWIHPYAKDGAGTSVIVTRSAAADKLIQTTLAQGKLNIHLMPLEEFLKSQSGSFNHRQKAQPFRIKKATDQGDIIPPKRFVAEDISYPSKLVQTIRLKVRANSLLFWSQYPGAASFDSRMRKDLLTLKVVTKLNQKIRKYLD
ncbi:Coenzyme F420 hydrogenase/dehydrogenase, beta subunit C-terminal domain [Pontibacter sp. HSC-36F09]|uniref:Coenzyme F420 hydrogenase/dehydrogenase, beta subunit C-terminal domain n=1 Tax=Pontibacter sp. HSC-36F09 TaxID=2910966 RepID=UPI0020A0830C|nr:Coenzyme F420 hydrogenase/dehydrogenase, beta subunit C-terminal domain [Pontibacter sp. HSC-36F09]MCP2043982.1 coenzyme F420-reducing hydrogenase beta subunit [Pontibacter sp. HSC-36F09]